MAFIGSDQMAKRARFTDTVNSLQSLVQLQYESVQSGVNTRAASAGCAGAIRQGADSCLLLGKVLSFTPGSGVMNIRPVTTTAMNIEDAGTIYSQIALTSPVVSSSTQMSELQWGAVIREASRASGVVPSYTADTLKSGSTRALINAVAFLRGPNSAEIITYFFRYDSSDTDANVQIGLRNAVTNYATTAQTTGSVCIHNVQDYTASSTPVAAVLLGGAGGTSGIATNFDAPVGATGIC